MYLSKLSIHNFRIFSNQTEIEFSKGLNLLVGENGCGKSATIDAIRALLNKSDFSRKGISEEDFYVDYSNPISTSTDCIEIVGTFSNLNEDQKIEYLTWLTNTFDARLNLEIQHTTNTRNIYKQHRWGGMSSGSIFDWEPLNDIQCVYLPPLRDAEHALKSGRGSRLARLIANLSEDKLKETRNQSKKMQLEIQLEKFNSSAAQDDEIIRASQLINESLEKSAGAVYGQKTAIQFNQLTYERIIESLQILFFPKGNSAATVNLFRSLSENSLGYNNLIYIATILAEFEGLKDKYTTPRILLVEELEAHLHPQLQIKLLNYLQEQARENDIQVIITTHSVSLASAVQIDSIISFNQTAVGIEVVPLRNCGVEEKSKKFIERWMDATKSTLLFSKGNILVEGIAETIVVPRLAQVYLKRMMQTGKCKVSSLEEAGISVINMNGIYFTHFMQLYNGYQVAIPEKNDGESMSAYNSRIKELKKRDGAYQATEYTKVLHIPQKCVALTDNDPPKELGFPQKGEHLAGKNPFLYYKRQAETMTENCRVFINCKTFEYDLAIESHHNAKVMLEVLMQLVTTKMGCDKIENYIKMINEESQIDDTEMAAFILTQIETPDVGKGLFAQLLCDAVDDMFDIPTYIMDAIDFMVGIKNE